MKLTGINDEMIELIAGLKRGENDEKQGEMTTKGRDDGRHCGELLSACGGSQ